MRGGDAEMVQIGYIRKPVGLDGTCGVTPQGATLEQLDLPHIVRVGPNDKSAREVVLVSVGPHPRGCRCRFEGVDDCDSAEHLRGFSIYLAQGALPAAGQSEYYHFELEGARVVRDDNGEELGVVTQVHNYPSVDALEVRMGDGSTVLVPITNDAVREIDKDRRIVTVDARHIDELLV